MAQYGYGNCVIPQPQKIVTSEEELDRYTADNVDTTGDASPTPTIPMVVTDNDGIVVVHF